MCGIIGKISLNNKIDSDLFLNQILSLKHRGPDNQGFWLSKDKKIALGHCRLSIIDLNETANQPMTEDLNNYTIVFNGEIYNYLELKKELELLGNKFKTNSDTEVILKAYIQWGEKCINRFVGMFALAIYDSINNLIFLARDRAGEKPLYYYKNEHSISFASELKALLKDPNCPRTINKDALKSYFYFNYVQGKQSIIDGIYKLLPGYFALIDLNHYIIKTQRYWELPTFTVNNKSNDELLNSFDYLLRDSIKKQLIADVPIGILLSGGLDSSIITAIASEYKNNINTFTVKFTGHNNLDETEHSRLIANHFGTNHIELEANKVEPEILQNLVKFFDEPFSDTSLIPTYLVSNLVRKHCKVVLGGDGGDELFGGYVNYQRFLNLKNKFTYIPKQLGNLISKISERVFPLGTRGLATASLLRYDFNNEAPVYSQFNTYSLHKLLPCYFSYNSNERFNSIVVEDEKDIINRLTKTDFLNYLPDDILTKIDRASMANSLEMRAPYLDYNIIEFAYREVPSNFKVTNNDKKIFLKEYGKRILPKSFDFSRKQGFSAPIEAWLKEDKWKNYIKDILSDNNCVFSKKAIKDLLTPSKIPVLRGHILMSLTLFELWKKEYSISL